MASAFADCAMAYTRPPSSRLVLWIFNPCLLPRMLMKPRTVCFCQPVVFMICSKMAPPLHCSIAITAAFLPPSRAPPASLLAAGLAAFLLALACFFGVAFLPAFATFFWLAPFFEEALSGATWAPCSATAAVFSVLLASAFVMVVSGNSFLRQIRRMTSHHSGCRETQGKSGRLGHES